MSEIGFASAGRCVGKIFEGIYPFGFGDLGEITALFKRERDAEILFFFIEP